MAPLQRLLAGVHLVHPHLVRREQELPARGGEGTRRRSRGTSVKTGARPPIVPRPTAAARQTRRARAHHTHRFRLDVATVSMSTKVTCATPIRARVIPMQEPTPPEPTTKQRCLRTSSCKSRRSHLGANGLRVSLQCARGGCGKRRTRPRQSAGCQASHRQSQPGSAAARRRPLRGRRELRPQAVQQPLRCPPPKCGVPGNCERLAAGQQAASAVPS